MTKQTAVQAFIEWAISLKDREQQCIDWIVIKNKAEELLPMEKEQIVDAYCECWMMDGGNGYHKEKEANEYYNETYN